MSSLQWTDINFYESDTPCVIGSIFGCDNVDSVEATIADQQMTIVWAESQDRNTFIVFHDGRAMQKPLPLDIQFKMRGVTINHFYFDMLATKATSLTSLNRNNSSLDIIGIDCKFLLEDHFRHELQQAWLLPLIWFCALFLTVAITKTWTSKYFRSPKKSLYSPKPTHAKDARRYKRCHHTVTVQTQKSHQNYGQHRSPWRMWLAGQRL